MEEESNKDINREEQVSKPEETEKVEQPVQSELNLAESFKDFAAKLINFVKSTVENEN